MNVFLMLMHFSYKLNCLFILERLHIHLSDVYMRLFQEPNTELSNEVWNVLKLLARYHKKTKRQDLINSLEQQA